MKLTALIEKSDDGWYVGQVEEMPAVISQGLSIEEVKENLADAVKLLLETNREILEKDNEGRDVIREELSIAE